jgi:uncharacterized protein (TIGR04255 family)
MPRNLPEPLGGSPPPEVSLPRAPLDRVLVQARFPGILKIDNKDSVASFQEAIRRDYPLFEQDTIQHFQVQIGQPGGPAFRQMPGNLWRFLDSEKRWRLSLATDQLSLETERYTSRDDFIDRWSNALRAVERFFDPQIVVRLGMRFIDRIKGEQLKDIDELVRPDILGVIKPPLNEHVRQALSEAVLTVAEGEMLLRWGILPANGTIDPVVLSPVPERTWILDIDVWSAEQRPFRGAELGDCSRTLAQRAYSVFRYMTTNRFLQTYGGQI